MPSTASTTYQDYVEGKLIAAIATGTTSGVTVKVKQINGATPTWPTAAHRLKIFQKTATIVHVEEIGVAAGTTQSGQTVTLGTLTRALSLSDGTNFSGSAGTAQAFSAGADVFLSWDHHDAAQTPKLDIANTFTGVNTFSSDVVATGSLKAPVYANAAARDVAIPSPANGMEAYLTAEGKFTDYVAGAWTDRASGTNPNMSTTVAGKSEEGTVAEQAAHTATGGTGARLVPAVANLVTLAADPTWISGAIPTLNASKYLDVSLLGSGTPTAAKYLLGDGSWGTISSSYFDKTVFINATTSATVGTSSTAAVDVATHQYTIPANDLVAGVLYEFNYTGLAAWGAGELKIRAQLGSTAIVSWQFTPTNNQYYTIHGYIMGTAAAGASVEVRGGGTILSGNPAKIEGPAASPAANVATNGTLVLKLNIDYDASNGSNAFDVRSSHIRKSSTTAF